MGGSTKWGEGIEPATGRGDSAAIGQRADSTNPLGDEKFVVGTKDMHASTSSEVRDKALVSRVASAPGLSEG